MQHRTPDALKIDVGSATTREELHCLVAKAFGFPDYYGKNWDAFDECIRDVELALRVENGGLETLRTRLPREAELLQQCVADFVEESHRDIIFRPT